MNTCRICDRPIGPRAKTCGAPCRRALFERRRRARVPEGPAARAAWEQRRRLFADSAIKDLELLADYIPSYPADAGALLERCLQLTRDLRRTFHRRPMPAASPSDVQDEEEP